MRVEIVKPFNFAHMPFYEFYEFRQSALRKCSSIVVLYFSNCFISQIVTRCIKNRKRHPYRFCEIIYFRKKVACAFKKYSNNVASGVSSLNLQPLAKRTQTPRRATSLTRDVCTNVRDLCHMHERNYARIFLFGTERCANTFTCNLRV